MTNIKTALNNILASNKFKVLLDRIETYTNSYTNLPFSQKICKLALDTVSYIVYQGLAFLGMFICYLLVF